MRSRFDIQKIVNAANLPYEPIPGLPLVEITGDCRVLVERHRGVIAYEKDLVRVKVSFGQIIVCGCGLELTQMTRNQLVISGRIASVSVQRGC